MQDSTLAPTHNGLSTEPPSDRAPQPSAGSVSIIRAVTLITGTVVGLTFLFGFGNVLDLALHLGVPVWVAPLVAPAVDLSVIGLLLAIRHLSLAGATIGPVATGPPTTCFCRRCHVGVERGRSDHRR